MNTMREQIGAMFVIGIILLSQCNALSEYTLEGIATFGPASQFPTMRFNLTLENRDKEYRITAKAIDGEWYNDEVTSGDGLDNYYLDQTWPSWDARAKKQGYREAGTVIEGDFPANSLSIVQLTWLMYCSASHFHTGTNSLTIPLRCAKYAPADGLTEVVSFTASAANVVDKIQCFTYTAPFASNNTKAIAPTSLYDRGYLLWEIHATTFTNLGSLTLPRSFEYDQYIPNGTNSSDLNCVMRAKFVVTNILAEVTAQSLLPMTTMKDAPVFDWRFNKDQVAMDKSGQMGTPVVTYKINDGKWRKRDDSGIKYQVIAIRQMVHTTQPAKGGMVIKWFVYSALIILTLFLGWCTKRKTNKPNK